MEYRVEPIRYIQRRYSRRCPYCNGTKWQEILVVDELKWKKVICDKCEGRRLDEYRMERIK